MKLLVISEYAAAGSGYTTITAGLIGELGRRGHEFVVIAFSNKGAPHARPAAVVPTDQPLFKRQVTMTRELFRPDAIVVIMDVGIHRGMAFLQAGQIPYIGIFPIEAEPLIHPTDTTTILDTMEGCLCESRFGTQLLEDVGIRATYFPVGVDDFWKPPTPEQRRQAREARNLSDRFVVLTVADNHERKNLPTHYAAVSLLAGNEIVWPVESGRRRKLPRRKAVPNVYYIVNTKRRPGKPVSYDNFDLVERFGLAEQSMVLEHDKEQGLSPEELRALYWSADAFLLLSKAEGLGLPVMEAQACGVPVVGTDCTGIKENLADGRGLRVPEEYVHIDPFYNQFRRWANPELAAECLSQIARKRPETMIQRALAYARTFTWQRSADIFEEVLNGACREETGKAGGAEGAQTPTG